MSRPICPKEPRSSSYLSNPGDWLTEEDRRCSAPSSEGLGRRRQGRSARRRGRYPSRTSVALKNRRICFTATAQEHVRREKAWWLANRDHTDVFTGRSSRRFQVPEPSTLSLPFPAFAASTSGESPPISI